ncbi:nitroreductase family protein [Pseudomonas guariconensis]|uniref:nitroreductase family protein n=1 Tax=Pseudomonas TaxID=286 RepID=UPI002097CCA4|nr:MULTISPECIES: nitroreductase family protein [Pseudomonas]MCO7636973.1 nitroreductase family protein [Pseudomonas sp. S 311-6]MCO7516907.1 nitroreductase family protein [Pseudomonas putida]MCO7564885.1 nitroreductase family protein [Pseudomonas mosselii]MCO7594842.1 nitroreductase family protein [Pseudomonas guariconensis]MCO7607350.1 nitroreductase family protein [Pseudomonas guariconensis]
MSIPHDHYLKFTTREVTDETLAFHAKGNFVIHRATRHLSTLHHIPLKELKKLTGNELKLNIFTSEKGHRGEALQPLRQNHSLHRNNSCNWFDEREMQFETVKALLSPLLVKGGSSYRRGYPSGGALYPIEVFCINLNNKIKHWPTESSALHLLPSSRTLEAYSPKINIDLLSNAITQEHDNIGSPSLAIIYFIYLPKAIFKYRYRGYRLALMEAGSMYMLTDLRCKELQLHSRPWSGFTDYEVTKELNLNPALFLPACIQLIG